MAARKVLTRAESQAQTRQALLDAAEQLFYTNGYHATSIAAIAAEAGRTIGAVYSNFDSKESLCREVMRIRFMSEVTALMEGIVRAGDSMDARFEALSAWWTRLATETSLVTFAAEYLTSTFNDADQVAANRDVIARITESVRAVLGDALPEGISETDPRLDDAINAVVSTGTGLAIGQAIGLFDGEQGASLMVATLRMWLEKLESGTEVVAT
ncbi:TetR/AcrR family transcriptional regulator [Mycobacterium sp. IS-3022]|uniref:TetR/AcrR family transcriptional regulator n=1 Tax=Mycobacterium sp. IS-3022 TaxID=1772277 RepID=UPI000AF9CD61|nr:TetR/AcrR family transcriptional regulator [Mycobacterium sp. IS-3022]